MYAVIASGGKQYRVEEGQTVRLELLGVEPGKAVTFDQVLMVADGDKFEVGSPYVKGMKVHGEVLREGRADKVHIIKFRRRKHHLKQQGHRQHFSEVMITGIGEAKKKAAKAKTVAKKPVEEKTTTEE